MIFQDPNDLTKRITELTRRSTVDRPKVFLDTSEFLTIDIGSIIRIGGDDFFVLGHAREGRFGMDDEPKFWVKTAVDLTTGEKKIIKLEFKEFFTGKIGGTHFNFHRNPEKEDRILECMHGHPSFMQGRTVQDTMGNLVRVIDFIPGMSLYEYLRYLDIPHEVYYRESLPEMMNKFIGCVEAIKMLHEKGLHHGDIRADHILIHRTTGNHIWIDFEYEVSYSDYDLFCLGNILLQVVGKGRHSLYDITMKPSAYSDIKEPIEREDMSLMFPHRIANLRKIFHYISSDLNAILLRFSAGCDSPYRNLDKFLSDLRCLFPPYYSWIP